MHKHEQSRSLDTGIVISAAWVKKWAVESRRFGIRQPPSEAERP
jgi:hypothetical protein